jgi:hypothetical protein
MLKEAKGMFKNLTRLFIMAVVFFSITASFAEENVQKENDQYAFLTAPNLEWSDYGLNFEWFKDKELLQEMNFTPQQAEELNKLVNEAAKTVKITEDTEKYEKQLKDQIVIKDFLAPKGKENPLDLTQTESLIHQISGLKSEKYNTQMLLKAKLKVLLTDKQKDVLYYDFIKKEAKQKAKMREQEQKKWGGHGIKKDSSGYDNGWNSKLD